MTASEDPNVTLTLHVAAERGEPCPTCTQPCEASIVISGLPGVESRTVFGCWSCGWGQVAQRPDRWSVRGDGEAAWR